jgi:hypothetical protein
LPLILAALALAGCGYRISGRGDTLPRTIHTIAVPAFSNASIRYRLSDRLAAEVTREFITRTRYDVIADPSQADAVLTGTVVNYAAYPTVYDPSVGRSSAVQISVNLSVTLRERATGAVLFSRQNFEVRERYEISIDQQAYLEESDVAIERLSRATARAIVSAVLENF